MRILELFSGIGAVSLASRGGDQVVSAVDINQSAMQVFRANFRAPSLVREISSLSDQDLAEMGADLWWMSPPCQPFTRRGLRKDLNDSRTRPLLHLIEAIERIQPTHIAMENVVGFGNSETHHRLVSTLKRSGYQYSSTELCSTQFGLPNLRPRFFLAASKSVQPDLTAELPLNCPSKTVAEFLDSVEQLARWQNDLAVDATEIAKFHPAINIATPDSKITRCFTSAYGRSFVQSGSYLKRADGYRRFSPTEVCRLLGFPGEFQLPLDLPTHKLWKMIGNSVSIPCAKHVLRSFDPQLVASDTGSRHS